MYDDVFVNIPGVGLDFRSQMTHFSYEIMRKMVATKWGGWVEHQPAIPCLSTDSFRKYPTGRSVYCTLSRFVRQLESRRTIDSIIETTPPEILVPQSCKLFC